jgi:hypothetical protein
MEAENRARMRLLRMNHIPVGCDDAAYSGKLCSKFAAPQQHKKFPTYQIFDAGIGSRPGTEIVEDRRQPFSRI